MTGRAHLGPSAVCVFLALGSACLARGVAKAGTAPATPALLPPAAAAEMGDILGARPIPPPVLAVLTDPHIDPVTAYLLRQAARQPIERWTMQLLFQITSLVPTLAETGIAVPRLQALYKFLGLDPSNLFRPRLGQDWQTRSSSFDPRNGAAFASPTCAAAISTGSNGDISLMTVGEFAACTAKQMR